MKLVAAAALALSSASFAPVEAVEAAPVASATSSSSKWRAEMTRTGCINDDGWHSRRDDLRGPSGDGARSQCTALAIVKNAMPLIRDCGRQHGVTDEVKLEWAIDDHGAVRGAHAVENHAGTPVGTCVERVISSLSFGEGQPVPRVTFPCRMR